MADSQVRQRRSPGSRVSVKRKSRGHRRPHARVDRQQLVDAGQRQYAKHVAAGYHEAHLSAVGVCVVMGQHELARPDESQKTVEVKSAITTAAPRVMAEQSCSPTRSALAISISAGRRTATGPVACSRSVTGTTFGDNEGGAAVPKGRLNKGPSVESGLTTRPHRRAAVSATVDTQCPPSATSKSSPPASNQRIKSAMARCRGPLAPHRLLIMRAETHACRDHSLGQQLAPPSPTDPLASARARSIASGPAASSVTRLPPRAYDAGRRRLDQGTSRVTVSAGGGSYFSSWRAMTTRWIWLVPS